VSVATNPRSRAFREYVVDHRNLSGSPGRSLTGWRSTVCCWDDMRRRGRKSQHASQQLGPIVSEIVPSRSVPLGRQDR